MPRRPERLLLLGGLMIAGQLGLRGWALSGSWFYFDDLAFMSRAMNQPFDSDYLLESYGGHLMPAGFALVRVLTDAATYQWWPWALTLLVLQALASIGIFRLLLSMFGRRPFVLVLLAGYLFWVFTLSAGIWFAAGINQLPLQIALGFGLTAHLGYLRTPRIRYLVTTLLWTAFGLAFYEKTLILFGIYALVAIGWFSTGNTPQRLRGLWDRYRLGIVVHGAVAAVYLAAYVHWGLDFGLGESAGVSWGPIAWNLVGVALAAALVGGPITWETLNVGSLANPSDLLLLVSWAGCAGVIAYAFFTRTMSKRAWSLLGFTLLANVVLLASARASIVGPEIGREYRYQTESAAIVVLCLGLAFLPLRGAVEVNSTREGVPRTYEGRVFVGVVTLLIVALSVVSTVRYVDLWQSRNDSEAFFRNARTTIAAAEHPVPMVDTGIPQTLLWSFRFPENSYSHILRPYADKVDYPRSSVDGLFILDDDGRLSPVRLEPAREMKETKGCGYRLDDDGTTTIPLDGPVLGGGWWIDLSYESSEATPLTLTAGEEEHELDLPAGDHDVFVQAAGEFRSVELSDYPTTSDLCVTGLVLGTPVPDSPT
ncbi:hypothetical protein [Nocardioides endophyticus]|uniref:hypothetical protein n=1 Tax=Nocardioides endophyticus TaxID=1353775 RepID=UPI0031EF449D